MGKSVSDSQNTPPAAETLPSAEAVARFLRSQPDFFASYPDILTGLELPGRSFSAGVGDLQQAQIKLLRQRLDEATEMARQLIETSRHNMQIQGQIHQAIVQLMQAENFERLIDIIHNELPIMLQIDVIILAVEVAASESDVDDRNQIALLPPGTIDQLMGGAHIPILLEQHCQPDPLLYGPAESLVASQALVRLPTKGNAAPALLAFGMRDEWHFTPGQGQELLSFLAAMLAEMVALWLEIDP